MRAVGRVAGDVRSAWAVLVLAACAVAAVLVLPTPEQDATEAPSTLPDSYQSVQVEGLLQQLPSALAQAAVVVVSRQDGTTLDDTDVAAVVDALGAPGGDEVLLPLPPPQTSADGTVALVLVPLRPGLEVLEAGTVVVDVRAALQDLPAGVVTAVTGGPAFTADLAAVFEGADVDILLVTALVVALILALTYRSPLLVVVPLIVVGAAEQVVVRLIEVLFPALGLVDNGGTGGIVSILVFGAATNYALLLVARYREQLRVTASPREAMRTAVERAGGAILASGGTVVLAVLALLLSQVQDTRALGAGAALGVAVAVLAGLVVLPCALVLLGRAAFWPLVPRLGSTGREGRVWDRLGRAASRRPGLVVLAGAAALLALAAPALGVQVGLSQSEQFRETPEAVVGARTAAMAFGGSVDPAVVVARADDAAAVLTAAEGVAGVVSAAEVERTDDLVRIDAVLAGEPRTERSDQAVRDLREAVGAVPGAGAVVGGQVAADLDRSDAEARDRRVVIPVILTAVLVVLVVLLRSLVAPLLLLTAVVATFFASVGASWVLFRTVFDFPALEVPVLLICFVFLVALGVDYSIFLTTRAREEAAVRGTPEGMLTALRVTGGVITSAGVLLASVFAVLGVLPLILLTQIGVVVAVGVLLDTLLVRTLIVPALAFRLGGAFWWPARVDPHPDEDPAGTGSVTDGQVPAA